MPCRLSPRLPSALLLAAMAAGPLIGCIDNSAGPPPEGELLSSSPLELPSFFCGVFEEEGRLILDEDDVDEFLDGCEVGDEEGAAAMRTTMMDAIAAFVPERDQGLVMVSVVLGGCTREFDVNGVFLDGAMLRPWVRISDTSFGRPNVACPADIGEGLELLIVDGIESADEVELHVGVFNGSRPGGPWGPGR